MRFPFLEMDPLLKSYLLEWLESWLNRKENNDIDFAIRREEVYLFEKLDPLFIFRNKNLHVSTNVIPKEE